MLSQVEHLLSPTEQSKRRLYAVAQLGHSLRVTVHRTGVRPQLIEADIPCIARPAIVGQVTIDGEFQLGGYALSEIVRRVRRTADFSQRELAKFAKVSAALIGGVEKGRVVPSLAALQRILNAANYLLVVVDADGHFVAPLLVWQDVADGAGRRYPAHLDTILDPVGGDWWASVYGLTYPPETFRRNRAYRDWKRAQSAWEVRVAKYRSVDAPRPPRGDDAWLPDDG